MRIINIMLNEIKMNLRDKTSMIMMVLFPILLITILGFAFSNEFSKDTKVGDMKVIYTDKSSKALSSGFSNFIKNGKSMNIQFEKINSVNDGVKDVKNAKCDGYILLKGNNIMLYKNNKDFLSTNIIESILRAFVDRFNSISVIAQNNPTVIQKIASDENYDFTKVVSLNRKSQPSSVDYYSVTMLTLIILYGAMSGLYSIGNERTMKTGNRLLCSPTKKYEILTGKLFGNSFAILLQSILVFLFSKYILGANWGTDLFTIFTIVFSEILFSMSIGICASLLLKNTNAASGIINTIIPFMAFLGGSYFPINLTQSSILIKLANLSPIKWTNNSIIDVIFGGNYSDVPIAIMINLVCAAVLILITSYSFRKEAF